MPLSEQEQRLLEQMERALYAEDPKFATSMRHARGAAGDRRRVALGVVALLVGLAMLVGGVATKMVVLGVLGFVAMVGGLWLAIGALRPGPHAAAPNPGGTGGPTHIAGRPAKPARPKHRSGESLAERMEERWRRRRETGDF